jgi:hypothetical protein
MEADGDFRAVRYFLQQTVRSLQETMRTHEPSRRLEWALAMLWSTTEILTRVSAIGGPTANARLQNA